MLLFFSFFWGGGGGGLKWGFLFFLIHILHSSLWVISFQISHGGCSSNNTVMKNKMKKTHTSLSRLLNYYFKIHHRKKHTNTITDEHHTKTLFTHTHTHTHTHTNEDHTKTLFTHTHNTQHTHTHTHTHSFGLGRTRGSLMVKGTS